MKKLFKSEQLYRTFIFAQITGLLIIIVMDILLGKGWDFLGDFFNSYVWVVKQKAGNWIALICIFAPFYITKGIDWILDSKEK